MSARSDDSLELLSPTDTLRGYDLWSTQYDGGDNPMIAATAWSLDARPLALRDARVLELGCGTGRNAARVLAGGARAYLGVDGSAGMLDLARARVADPRCAWKLAALDHEIALGDPGSFDVALIVLVLEHLRSLSPLFATAARALRPGGVLRIAEIHPSLVGAGTVAHFHDGAREVRFTSVAHDLVGLQRQLSGAGFAIAHIEEHLADGALLAAVPRLAKHRGRAVVLDVAATRA